MSDLPMMRLPIQHDDMLAVRVVGDAMAPVYREGDIVLVETTREPRDGDDCYVALHDGQTTFRRIFFDGDNWVRLMPHNPDCPPLVVGANEIATAYPAAWVFRGVQR